MEAQPVATDWHCLRHAMRAPLSRLPRYCHNFDPRASAGSFALGHCLDGAKPEGVAAATLVAMPDVAAVAAAAGTGAAVVVVVVVGGGAAAGTAVAAAPGDSVAAAAAAGLVVCWTDAALRSVPMTVSMLDCAGSPMVLRSRGTAAATTATEAGAPVAGKAVVTLHGLPAKIQLVDGRSRRQPCVAASRLGGTALV
eukprot:353839-Chlamydomonas_euryale.AAC.21